MQPKAPPVITLVLPIKLLSKNGRDALHRMARHRLRQEYERIIAHKYPRKHPTPEYRQRVTVTRVLGPRERVYDTQNLSAGSAVELLDSMTRLGWWIDDSPRYLYPVFEQGRSRKEKGPCTIVEIKRADDV